MGNSIVKRYLSSRVEGALARAHAFKPEHNGTLGRLREITVEELLRPLIPTNWDVSTGIVIDSFGNATTDNRQSVSGQEDLIVYSRSHLPEIWRHAEQVLIPIESCLGVIEVKSKLTTPELMSSIRHASRIRSMQPRRPFRESPKLQQMLETLNIPLLKPVDGSQTRPSIMPFYAVFSFDTSLKKRTADRERQRLAEKLKAVEPPLHALCVAQVGAVIFDREAPEGYPSLHLLNANESRDEILWFFAWLVDQMRLLETIRTELLIPPSLMAYLDTGAPFTPGPLRS